MRNGRDSEEHVDKHSLACNTVTLISNVCPGDIMRRERIDLSTDVAIIAVRQVRTAVHARMIIGKTNAREMSTDDRQPACASS